MEEIRLQKYLASSGIASRRKCEEYILQGKIKVNDKVIYELGTKINPNKDIVEFNNMKVKNNPRTYTYILLNKPIGYITTAKEQFGRPSVLDLIDINLRLVPVGRLDMYTSGALILTNDGDFVYKVTHPKYKISKTYIVTLNEEPSKEEIEQLKNGIKIDGILTHPAEVKIIKSNAVKNKVMLEITIHEGRNRQVRKMCEAIGKKVLSLHRSKIGAIEINNLEIGKWRYLTPEEVKKILKK